MDTIHDKIVDYFENGSRLVWVVNPGEQVVLIYHSPQPDQLLRQGDVISGEDVIPGFSTPVSDLFSDLDL